MAYANNFLIIERSQPYCISDVNFVTVKDLVPIHWRTTKSAKRGRKEIISGMAPRKQRVFNTSEFYCTFNIMEISIIHPEANPGITD